MSKTPNFQAKAEGEALELMIYDAIGPDWAGMVSAKAVTKALNENKDAEDITVRINSPGGDAFDGIAIHNALKSHKASVKTVAEGMAASAASVIFMAGDEREIHKSAMLMIHDASGFTMGNQSVHENQAEALGKLDGAIASTYANATGGDPETIRELMDEDYWMSAEDAITDGYATAVIDGAAPTSHFDLSMFNSVPPQVAERFGQRDQNQPQPETSEMSPDEFKAKHKDVVDGWLNDENAAGYAECKKDLAAMIEACGGDVGKGYTAFLDGKSLVDARNEFNQSVVDQLAEAKADADKYKAQVEELKNGSDALNLSADAEIKDEPSEEDKAKSSVQARAAKIKNEYARNAFIASCGYDPKDFNFED